MNKYSFEPEKYQNEIISIINDASSIEEFSQHKFDIILKKYPKDGNKVFSKDNVVRGSEWLLKNRPDLILREKVEKILPEIKMKPTRTISGVTTVTVLTKPFACPGKCVFCPNDIRMPKSYIANEPGAQRALLNRFSPFEQVRSRLQAYKNIGHPTDKIELIILGGTWSYYTERYKLWFIYECFRAMNEFSTTPFQYENTSEIKSLLENDINKELRDIVGDKPYNQLIVSKEYKERFGKNIVEEKEISWEMLENEHKKNALGSTRCVGLVLETRSDVITQKEVLMMRKLGATKIQLGIQSTDDKISDANKRGETKEQVKNAFKLLRIAGFKIHGHIMPNLYKSTPEKDFEVYRELFDSEFFKPDELKVYPTSIIKNTELYHLWRSGLYKPYSTEDLTELLKKMIEYTPEYCRLTRIIRDIPSTEIESGNKKTNLRELVEKKIKKVNNRNIRAREIKGKKIKFSELKLDKLIYETEVSTEIFLQYITNEREIAGFIRLSLPKSHENIITSELNKCAMIREVHVYGPSLELNKNSEGQAQHLGLGTKLIEIAKGISKENGFDKIAVISSIGTREYYEKRGFKLQELYQISEI